MRQLLSQHFDENELHDLCFDLAIDYEYLPATAKKVEQTRRYLKTLPAKR
jgi:hypothetical protein